MTGCPPTLWSESTSASDFPYSIVETNQNSIPVPAGATTYVLQIDVYSDTGNVLESSVSWEVVDSTGTLLTSLLGIRLDTLTFPHTSGTFTLPGGAARMQFGGIVVSDDGHPVSQNSGGQVNWSGTCDPTVICQYGTEPKTGVVDSITITTGLLEALSIEFGFEFAVPILLIAVGSIYIVDTMCSVAPPHIPASFAGVATGTWPTLPSLTDVQTYLQYLMWSNYCQCTPATGTDPTPTPPPTPVIPPATSPIPPGGGPTTPPVPILCDNTDLCTTLNKILALDTIINSGVQTIISMLSKLQIPGNSNRYMNGTSYRGLSGTSILTVSGILGVGVSCTTIPSHIGRNEDNDPEYELLGTIQYWGGYGWMPTHEIHHMIWMTADAPSLVQRLEYSFVPGVVADITLLVPLP